MKFPNKVIAAAYAKGSGKTFTWSPGRQVFTDEDGSTNYVYSAMLWLMEREVLVRQPWNGTPEDFVYKYKMKEGHDNR